MSIHYKEEIVKVPNGFKCDKCGLEYDNYHDPVQLRHEFGYYSDHDLKIVEAYVCENCFYDIVKNIADAKWDTYG